MTPAPILLFVYNRPEHTRRLIESLLKNDLASESPLIIYSDFNVNCLPEVNEVRNYIHSVSGFSSIEIMERTENWGLARNVIDGVTSVVERYGRVIVLEDDLILSPYFLQFMNDALEVYKDEPKVGHIQACDFTQCDALPDTFLIKWTGSWGWATWARAWKLFESDGRVLLEELERRNLTRTFDFNGNYPFTRMLRRQIRGENNSWAIRWNASLFLKDVLSLNVGKSLVQNVGFDGSGTNCGGGGLYASQLCMRRIPVVRISPAEENKFCRNVFEKYYHRTNGLWAKIRRRIKRALRGDFGR